MYRRTSVFGLIIALLGVLVLPSAGAQDEVLVSASADATASHVVNGAIIGLQSIDTGAQVHTLATVQVEKSVRGDLEGFVFVEVPGGKSNLGHDVWVSHQPYFEMGDRVQLALSPAPADEAAALAEGVPVYSVVHGIDGAAGLDEIVISQADAWGNYTLHGSKFATWPQTYRVNAANSGVGATATINAVRDAFQEWEDDVGSAIDFTYGGTTGTSASSYADGTNTISWVATPNPADGYLAQAVWLSSGSTIVGFDIAFNRDFSWSAGAVAGRFDIATVALHEAGHALGLGHTTADNAEIMYPSVTSGTVKHLGAGDRSGVRALYPSSSAPCVPVGTVGQELGSGPVQGNSSPSGYVPISPARLLDSRPGSQVGPFSTPWCAGETRQVQVAGTAGVPSSGVTAVAIQVTSVSPTAGGSYLTVRPSGTSSAGPVASKNFGTASSHVAVTNDLIIVGVGSNGRVDFYNNSGSVHFIVDIMGYFTASGGNGFVSLDPARILDSRNGNGGYTTKWGPSVTRRLQVTGRGGVPANGVTAVALHVTSVAPTASGTYLNVRPAGAGAGVSASKNFGTGSGYAALTNDLIIVEVGSGGALDFFHHAGYTHFVADVVGYFSTSGGDDFVAMSHRRVLDSRNGTGGYSSPWATGTKRSVQVAGVSGVPSSASAVMLHVTSVSPAQNSYLTVSPTGSTAAVTASKNFGPSGGHASVTNDLLIARVGSGGRIDLYNNAGTVNFVADIVGYFD